MLSKFSFHSDFNFFACDHSRVSGFWFVCQYFSLILKFTLIDQFESLFRFWTFIFKVRKCVEKHLTFSALTTCLSDDILGAHMLSIYCGLNGELFYFSLNHFDSVVVVLNRGSQVQQGFYIYTRKRHVFSHKVVDFSFWEDYLQLFKTIFRQSELAEAVHQPEF